MALFGLNSGTSAAMAIARRVLKLTEKIPQYLSKPEDCNKHYWTSWNKVVRYIKQHYIRRSQRFVLGRRTAFSMEESHQKCSHPG